MHLQEDMGYPFKGYHGCDSRCRIRIFAPDAGEQKPYIVICSELEDNPGTSVTNMAEHLATLLWSYLEKPTQGMTWIEHYEERAFFGNRHLIQEDWDLVTFQTHACGRFHSPVWRRLKKEDVAGLVGLTADVL